MQAHQLDRMIANVCQTAPLPSVCPIHLQNQIHKVDPVSEITRKKGTLKLSNPSILADGHI